VCDGGNKWFFSKSDTYISVRDPHCPEWWTPYATLGALIIYELGIKLYKNGVCERDMMGMDGSSSKKKKKEGKKKKKEKEKCIPDPHFFPGSIASPFLHAIILIRGAFTISFDSILNDGFLTINVQTSSHSRYVCRWPYQPVSIQSYPPR
jgi:hypothetical protein